MSGLLHENAEHGYLEEMPRPDRLRACPARPRKQPSRFISNPVSGQSCEFIGDGFMLTIARHPKAPLLIILGGCDPQHGADYEAISPDEACKSLSAVEKFLCCQ